MLNGINSENNDISKLLKGTKKNIKSANGSYADKKFEPYVVFDSESDFEDTSTYNQKGVVSRASFKMKEDTILPNRYNTMLLSGEIFYKGEKITQMDLIEKAVESGEIELDEDKSIWENYDNAWKTLIEDKAKPLYDWSIALYSEDGKYKFRVEDGEITGLISTMNSNGVSLQDVAIKLANGVSPDDISEEASWLSWNDKELYEASLDVASAKSFFVDATNDHNANKTTYQDYLKELEPLFFIMYGDFSNQTLRLPELNEVYTNDNFGEQALKTYNPKRYMIAFEY